MKIFWSKTIVKFLNNIRIKIMGKEFTLPEFSLSHEEKKRLEEEYFGGNEDKIKEKRWEKRAKESLREIERIIDEGLVRKRRKRKKKR